MLGPGGKDLPFELCSEQGRVTLEAHAEPASPAAVSRLGRDVAPLGFRRHEPPEDESGAPWVGESGLAGSDDAVAIVDARTSELQPRQATHESGEDSQRPRPGWRIRPTLSVERSVAGASLATVGWQVARWSPWLAARVDHSSWQYPPSR